MKYATFEYQGKQIRLGIASDDTNGGVYIETLEIDGQDCTNALDFVGLYDYFEKLLHDPKIEKL